MTTDTPAATTSGRRRGFLVFLRDVLVIVLISFYVSGRRPSLAGLSQESAP
jgi:signal peptidase I